MLGGSAAATRTGLEVFIPARAHLEQQFFIHSSDYIQQLSPIARSIRISYDS